MAESKYGSDKENHINYDFVKLGAGLTTFDLLRIKHTNVIQLEQLIAQSSTSKGAAFILYNVARLESILSVFDANVASGAYNKLPELDQIDFALLKEEVWTFGLYQFYLQLTICCCCDCRRNGSCCTYSSMVFQMYWNVA